MINLFKNKVIQNGLHIKVKSRYCTFKNVEIDLYPELFKSLLILAKNPKEYHRLDKVVTGELLTQKERTDAQRINLAFKKSGLTKESIVKPKMRIGYRLNPKVISPYCIEIED